MIINRIVPAILVVTMLSSSAFAAALTMTGVIKTVDATKNEVVLKSGETFALPAKFDLKKIKVGEKVSVTYEKAGTTMTASEIAAAK